MSGGKVLGYVNSDEMNEKPSKTISLTDDQRSMLEAICHRRKVDALVWKRARGSLLLGSGYDPALVCEMLDIGPTVLTEWRFAFAGSGLSFFGLKDYTQCQGHLTVDQEQAVKDHFSEHPALNVDEVCAHILSCYGESYSPSGGAKLMHRLGFEYKKPRLLPAQADEAKQAAFSARYEALMQSLAPDEMVVFSNAVHPEHQSAPAMAGYQRVKRPL